MCTPALLACVASSLPAVPRRSAEIFASTAVDLNGQ